MNKKVSFLFLSTFKEHTKLSFLRYFSSFPHGTFLANLLGLSIRLIVNYIFFWGGELWNQTIHTLQGTITYHIPPKNGILKMMIFPTSRLVGYVSFPWRVTISGTIFVRHLYRQAKRVREESESGSDSEEESIPKVGWETTKNPPGGLLEPTNGWMV